MRKLLKTIAFSIIATASLTSVSYAGVDAGALPSLGSATNADVTTTGNNMNIQINGGQGGVGTLNWNSYNVGKDAGVNYEFTAHNQTALNKVSAAGGLSQIFGKITASGCANCGYDATGKVILLNPNGVLFGDGANVNLNSFTVSNLDGNYNEATKQLELVKGSNQTDFGIVVEKGASIYGDKAVNLAANNVTLYNGSKIATNVAPNFNNAVDSFGKVKIVTADGVNFAYYDNGAVKSLSNITNSADKMLIQLNGDIKSGNIDVRNHSTNADSEINLKEATLKATKAVSGNDGNIWLTAQNKVIIEDSKLETVNYSADAANRTSGGDIEILAGNKVSIGSSDLDAVGNINITSANYDIALDGSTVDSAKDVNVTAGQIASLQNGAKVNAKNVNIKGGERAQIIASSVNADNVSLNADNVWFSNANVNAAKNIEVVATNGFVKADETTLKADKINMNAKTNVKGKIDLKDSQTNIKAGNDIDVTLANVGNRNNGLVAEAGNNLTVTTDGTLSVSSLISGNDMTINADKVIAGLPYTTETKLPDDLVSERSYIKVGGEFNSNVAKDNYTVTASGDLTADGKYNQKHHIQYGEDEKILLIHNRPYVAPVEPVTPVEPTPPDSADDIPVVSIDDDQASMLNKIPRQPETINANTNVTDTRTTFVDVYAAASQIEIEDDEE